MIWTVQPLIVWDRLEREGVLRVETDRLPDGYLPWQYRWLADQLKRRLPAWEGDLPWFAYCNKPDLRWVRHRHSYGERHVRIALEPQAGSFATYPWWAWNEIHGGQYLAATLAEKQTWEIAMQVAVPDWEDRWPLPEPWDTQLRRSW